MNQVDGVMLNMSLAVDLFLNPYEKTKKNILARLVVDTSSDVEPYLNGTRIHGHLRNSTITARVDFSNIGDVPKSFLNAFSTILSMTARQTIRSVLGVGIPIPSYDNVTVADDLEKVS
uniref:BPI2 domain-containing protein n=1 Tax=Caenorhabditis tropicalis TaxID=1561998 RepID=A0A1I7UV71_9PELO